MNTPEDRQLLALVEADDAHVPPPDLASLRAGGQRLVRRRRTMIGAGVAAAALAVVIPTTIVATSGDDPKSDPHTPVATDQSSPPTDPTTPPAEPKPTKPSWPEETTVPLPNGDNAAVVIEDGEILGEVVKIGTWNGYDEVIYAARRQDPGVKHPTTYVADAIRVGDQLMQVSYPMEVGKDEGVWMQGGEDRRSISAPEDPGYRLLGIASGERDVTVSLDGGPGKAPTVSSTDVLPGITVFVVSGPWQDGWDPLQAAPIVVTVDGKDYDARKVSVIS